MPRKYLKTNFFLDLFLGSFGSITKSNSFFLFSNPLKDGRRRCNEGRGG
jgi:hypothetical protein